MDQVSLNSLKKVAPDAFRDSDSMDRSLIPAEQAPLFDAFDKLSNSVTPYVPLFTDKSLSSRQHFLMQVLSNLLNLDPQRQTSLILVHSRHYPIAGDEGVGLTRYFDADISPFGGASGGRLHGISGNSN